jgi:hypothetical protein
MRMIATSMEDIAIPYLDRGCHTCIEDIISVYKHRTRMDDIREACEAEMPAMQRCMLYHTWIEDVIHVKKISYMYTNITHA